MKRLGLILGVLLLGAALHADLADTVKRVDELDKLDRSREAMTLLEPALAAETYSRNRAEILWRMARASLNLGDAAEREGAKKADVLAFFERGEQYAQQAMDASPGDFHGYFWKSGNLGRWGQTRGILQSLFKAGDMRVLLTKAVEIEPRDKGSFYVLGQLYREVPGAPLSFGNAESAANLGRRGLDLMEAEVRSGVEPDLDFDYYTELAKTLYKRNWNVERRNRAAADNRARLAAARDEITRGMYYESTVTLPAMSDREEARALVNKAIAGLRAIAAPMVSDTADLKEAEEALAGFR